MLISTSLLAMGTLFQTMFKVLVQDYEIEDVYLLPFLGVIPFRVHTWPRYLMAFALSVIKLLSGFKTFSKRNYFHALITC